MVCSQWARVLHRWEPHRAVTWVKIKENENNSEGQEKCVFPTVRCGALACSWAGDLMPLSRYGKEEVVIEDKLGLGKLLCPATRPNVTSDSWPGIAFNHPDLSQVELCILQQHAHTKIKAKDGWCTQSGDGGDGLYMLEWRNVHVHSANLVFCWCLFLREVRKYTNGELMHTVEHFWFHWNH